MKFVVILILSTVSLSLSLSIASSKQVDKGLPFEQDLTVVKIDSPSTSKEVELEFLLELPIDHKLNPGAPSAIGIYEKTGTEDWNLTEKISLNSYPVLSSEMHFKKLVALKSDTSEIAVFSTVFHCRKDNSRCQIQGFKAKAKRSNSKSSSNKISFNIRGEVK